MESEDIRARKGENGDGEDGGDGENGVHNEGTKRTETNEGSLLLHTCHDELPAECGQARREDE
jgi:hypothetical protein